MDKTITVNFSLKDINFLMSCLLQLIINGKFCQDDKHRIKRLYAKLNNIKK